MNELVRTPPTRARRGTRRTQPAAEAGPALGLLAAPAPEQSRLLALPPPEPAPMRRRPYRPGIHGVLDIGTTKITCLIGRCEADGILRVMGCGWPRPSGPASSASRSCSAAAAPVCPRTGA